MMKIFKYMIYIFCVLLLVIYSIVLYEENNLINTGFIPYYSKQDELEALVTKGKEVGLTKDESERLDWLMEDKDREVEIQLEVYKKDSQIGP